LAEEDAAENGLHADAGVVAMGRLIALLQTENQKIRQ
jgi:hypothetical protein